jgi:4-oxalocrotonate tautomerase
MPIVRVEIWNNESAEFKRKLAQDVTSVVARHIGCPGQAVTVIFTEVPKENWAIGGELATDLCERLKIGKK